MTSFVIAPFKHFPIFYYIVEIFTERYRWLEQRFSRNTVWLQSDHWNTERFKFFAKCLCSSFNWVSWCVVGEQSIAVAARTQENHTTSVDKFQFEIMSQKLQRDSTLTSSAAINRWKHVRLVSSQERWFWTCFPKRFLDLKQFLI